MKSLFTTSSNKITLRQYQKDLVDKYYQSLATCSRQLIQLPTGGGKTEIFGEIAKRYTESDARVLILAHRKELIDQTARRIFKMGINVGKIVGGKSYGLSYNLHVGSVQTLQNMIGKSGYFSSYDAIIIDEAHHSAANGYVKIINHNENADLLGVTATPIRLDGRPLTASRPGKDDCVELFSLMHCGPQASELIEMGYLAKPICIECEPKREGISIESFRTVSGEFSATDLEASYNTQKAVGAIVQSYIDYCPGAQAIVYAASVKHSIALQVAFEAAGIPAGHVDGKTPDDERREVFSDFETKRTKVLCNVSIATEGNDIPGIDVCIIARATASLCLFLQMCGRAMRVRSDKSECMIIDWGDNIERFGRPDEDRNWRLSGGPDNGKTMHSQSKSNNQQSLELGEIDSNEFDDSNEYNSQIVEIHKTVQKIIHFCKESGSDGKGAYRVMKRLSTWAADPNRSLKLTNKHLALVLILTNRSHYDMRYFQENKLKYGDSWQFLESLAPDENVEIYNIAKDYLTLVSAI